MIETTEWVLTEIRQVGENKKISTSTSCWNKHIPLLDYMLRYAAERSDIDLLLDHIAKQLKVEIMAWDYDKN